MKEPKESSNNISINKDVPKKKKIKDPEHMKYPYLIYGISFGLVLGLVFGYYTKQMWVWTLIIGAFGLIIGTILQWLHRNDSAK